MVLFILIVTVINIDAIDMARIRIIASFASCFTLLKLLDWFRLFEETAFYVHLVGETLSDIKYFALLLVTTLLMFGVPLLILEGNSADGKELIEGAFNFWVFDLVYNQYLLALGEFGLDNFADHPQAILVYLFFIAATLISQLTMLNMLIAIMGDSFDKVIEHKHVNATRTKLQILGDLSAILPK